MNDLADFLVWTPPKKVGKLRVMAKRPHKRTLGEVLTEARDALDPPPSFEQIARQLEGVTVSFQTVINYHDDAVAKPSVEIVQALVDFYGLTLTDLPDDLRERCELLRDRLVAASSGRRRKYAPRDSNPEPADFGHYGRNGVTSDLNAPEDSAGVAA